MAAWQTSPLSAYLQHFVVSPIRSPLRVWDIHYTLQILAKFHGGSTVLRYAFVVRGSAVARPAQDLTRRTNSKHSSEPWLENVSGHRIFASSTSHFNYLLFDWTSVCLEKLWWGLLVVVKARSCTVAEFVLLLWQEDRILPTDRLITVMNIVLSRSFQKCTGLNGQTESWRWQKSAAHAAKQRRYLWQWVKPEWRIHQL